MFLGRKDRLVKVRGYRVELDEVETVLNAVPEVAEAAAVALRNEADETVMIAAAAILRDGAELSAEALRARAGKMLSSYAVPSLVTIRTSLPRTGSGKIDRTALKNELETPTVAPEGTRR